MNALNPVRRDRRADRRADRGPPGPVAAKQARKRAGELLELVGIPRARAAAYPARAVGRHAPAGDDRDGARLRPGDRDRRRADDRPRRDGPGPDPGTAGAPAARPGPVAHPHHPRPVGHRRDVRPDDDHVRRQGRGGGPGLADLRGATPSVHGEAAGRLPEHLHGPAHARDDPGRAAGPARAARWLSLPSALSRRDGRVPRGRPAGGACSPMACASPAISIRPAATAGCSISAADVVARRVLPVVGSRAPAVVGATAPAPAEAGAGAAVTAAEAEA